MMNYRWMISANARGITELRLGKQGGEMPRSASADSRARRRCARAQQELRAYFAGRLRTFGAQYDISRLPRFTQAVLKLATKVPYGEVRSYAWIARALGKPKAARAVGNALARNPVPIIIPCHRIVRTDDTIGGFALGEKWKKRLLDLEKQSVTTRHRRKSRRRFVKSYEAEKSAKTILRAKTQSTPGRER